MRGFKDIIARRRPSSGSIGEDMPNQSPQDPDAGPEASFDPAAGHRDPPPLARATDYDIENARAARNHVPRPERPQPHPRREWNSREVRVLPSTEPQATAPGAPSAPPKVWDIDLPATPGVAGAHPRPAPDIPPPAPDRPAPPMTAAPMEGSTGLAKPAAPERPPSSQRVKTRLLGFHADEVAPDVFATPPAAAATNDPRFPIGWIVVIEGPGRGASFTLTAGLSTVGRDADQTVSLDFGDTSISRERHVAIAYDDEENRAYVGHGGKTNIVRHNDKPLLTTEELTDGDTIKIGKTVLRFVAFCTGSFSWADNSGPERHNG